MAARKLTTTTNPVQRAFGYARVSTDMQADSGISLDEQRRKIEARCLEHGWNLERIYVDAGVSGSTPLGRRPEGAKLLAMVRPGDVVIAARMDRCFRSALDALRTIEDFKRRKISLWLLDLGDVSGNGVSELIVTVLAAVAQFERTLISERIKDAKRNLRRGNRHQGGSRPFGYRFGATNGHGKARELIPHPKEQAAIAEMIRMRNTEGASLMAIRDAMRARGFWISHQLVANTVQRHAAAGECGT